MTPIAQAVEPLRQEAMEQAAQVVTTYVKSLLARLEAAGMDLNVMAPMPTSTMSRQDYLNAKNLRATMLRLTLPTEATRRPGQPAVRTVNQAAVNEFVEQARRDASDAYSAFVAKLEKKVGEHSAAALDGSHVWGFSILTVQTPAGAQRWKTQQIVNVSSLGKVFNQWPSRQVK